MFIMRQHAYHGKNKNIHYFPQIEHHNNTVDDMSKKVGGYQHMTILDKCKPQMSIINNLTCEPLRPHEDKEWEELPHVILASGMDWDHTVFDCEGQVYNEEWFDAQSSLPSGPTNESFDEIGNYRFRSNNHQIFFFDTKTYDLDEFMKTFIDCNNITTKSNDLEHELLQPLFNWKLLENIKKTFQQSTQCARTPEYSIMKKTQCSPFPAMNSKRRNEPVSTDTVYCGTSAVDNGSKCSQFFVGAKTMVTDVKV